MADKKIPMRTCIACRTEKPKKELIRIVGTKEGVYSLDFTGRASGRGAYVCNNADCVKKLTQKRLLNNAFKTEIDKSVYETIAEEYFGKKE